VAVRLVSHAVVAVKSVEVAFEKMLRPVQVLLSERSVEEAVVSTMHSPFTAKQPPERSMPLANVELAAVPVMLRYGVERPEWMVEVAEPATLRTPEMVVLPVLEMEKRVLVVVAKLR
jgi:hypothetical protein